MFRNDQFAIEDVWRRNHQTFLGQFSPIKPFLFLCISCKNILS